MSATTRPFGESEVGAQRTKNRTRENFASVRLCACELRRPHCAARFSLSSRNARLPNQPALSCSCVKDWRVQNSRSLFVACEEGTEKSASFSLCCLSRVSVAAIKARQKIVCAPRKVCYFGLTWAPKCLRETFVEKCEPRRNLLRTGPGPNPSRIEALQLWSIPGEKMIPSPPAAILVFRCWLAAVTRRLARIFPSPSSFGIGGIFSFWQFVFFLENILGKSNKFYGIKILRFFVNETELGSKKLIQIFAPIWFVASLWVCLYVCLGYLAYFCKGSSLI